jgi:thiosulfate/3-mercaptopyruvate sulfurtransferase
MGRPRPYDTDDAPAPTLPDVRDVTGLTRPELLVSTSWLAENIGRPEIRILDVRWRPDGSGSAAYAAGHIPAAAYIDWRSELIEPAEDDEVLLLAGPDRVAAAMGRAGVGDGTTVVIYDDTQNLFSSRVWWSLRAYGFESVRLLDGGLPAWAGEHRTLSNAQQTPATATFTPRSQLAIRLTTADVRRLLGSPDVQILDARAPAEYRGFEGNAKRLGHIPGAVNVPVGATNRPGSQHLRDADELRSILHKANVARGPRLVCYDGSGVAAAKLAFVLSLLGHDDVAVYDGGWAEWGNRFDLPVER